MLNINEHIPLFAAICQQHPTDELLHNATAVEMDFFEHSLAAFPISICHAPANQAWVVSPLTTYADYAQEEWNPHVPAGLNHILNIALSGIKSLLKRQHFAESAMLNNWLISTNLYPVLNKQAVEHAMQSVLQRYPRHALWWRSLNPHHHQDWLQHLQQLDYLLIPSRRIYLLDEPQISKKIKQDWRQDQRLFDKSTLMPSDSQNLDTPVNYEQALHLYNQLYLEKYSRLNPQYSLTWLQAMHQSGLMQLQTLTNAKGAMAAVTGSFVNQQHLVTPFFGFDTHAPQKLGYYRLANLLATDLAIAAQKNINLSAGAGHFKRQRGAFAVMEYSAVYIQHLPWRQQAAHRWVHWLCHKIGQPLMEKLNV